MSACRSLIVGAAVGLALAAGGCGSQGQTPATSTGIGPERFVRQIDNPWFPLAPGTVLRYRGVKDGQPVADVVEVTHATKRILGVRATVVRDRLYARGRLAEDTVDWYAQDRRGNVWYLGEDTRELDSHGRVTSTAGSWQAGVRGARAGILMPASPRVGQSFRQEYERGQAEDWSQVLSLRASVRVPGAASDQALRTQEWTPLEPGVLDNKYYVRGVGSARELTVKGGDERLELVSVTRG